MSRSKEWGICFIVNNHWKMNRVLLGEDLCLFIVTI